jgi:hypothetical protein
LKRTNWVGANVRAGGFPGAIAPGPIEASKEERKMKNEKVEINFMGVMPCRVKDQDDTITIEYSGYKPIECKENGDRILEGDPLRLRWTFARRMRATLKRQTKKGKTH